MQNNFSVKLASITQPIIQVRAELAAPGWWRALTPEEFIVYCARVSNPSNQSNTDTSAKLIKYLIEHKHWSPFEMVSMSVEIVTSRGIAQQLLRHRSFSFQEFSQRYAVANEQVLYSARRQDIKNRQNSIDNISEEDKNWFERAQSHVWEESNRLYTEALDRGIAKECARFLLPLNTKSVLYMNGTIRSWIHYLQTRLDKATQLEHRLIAEEIFALMGRHFPNVVEYIAKDIDRKIIKPSPLSEEEKAEQITD